MEVENSEIGNLVDRGCILDAKIKAMEDEKKEISDRLKAYGRESNLKKILGTEGRFASIRPYSKTSTDALEFIKTCEEMKVPEDSFIKALSVNVTKAKSILGEALLHSISEVKTDLYGSITYKNVAEV